MYSGEAESDLLDPPYASNTATPTPRIAPKIIAKMVAMRGRQEKERMPKIKLAIAACLAGSALTAAFAGFSNSQRIGASRMWRAFRSSRDGQCAGGRLRAKSFLNRGCYKMRKPDQVIAVGAVGHAVGVERRAVPGGRGGVGALRRIHGGDGKTIPYPGEAIVAESEGRRSREPQADASERPAVYA